MHPFIHPSIDYQSTHTHTLTLTYCSAAYGAGFGMEAPYIIVIANYANYGASKNDIGGGIREDIA